MIFGQLGNDVIQGDGSIADALAGIAHVGASRTPDGCSDSHDTDTADGTCDTVGDLDVVASTFENPDTDGQDYIEGGGGNDIVFGGLGQDDIIGGSSDFFSLATANERPDGADLLFGGSGQHIGRNDNGGVTLGAAVPDNRRTSDADVIVGDNGRIIRIVGTNGVDVCGDDGCELGDTRYVEFVYDDSYGSEQLVVRGVHLLDYTAGGPDFRPDRFGQDATGPCHDAAPGTVEDCSVVYPIANPSGRNSETSPGWTEVFGNDEVHGGLGDDVIYLGGGSDVAYGDADDDDIIGGWGNDWISGGVGQDAILGDDGRIFTSRNNATVGEPLYGVLPLQPTGSCTEKKTVLCDDVLNQWIASPGDVQTAVINIEGDLKKTVDLTPFNLTPNASGADQPLFDANNSDDVIFGGLGGEIQAYPDQIGGLARNDDDPSGTARGIAGDFLHGGAGDDAMAGGEAIENAYTQVYGADGVLLPSAYRSDWTRPFNPGDLLHFGEDSDAWHSNGPVGERIGEFALYDEYDPRRTILLNTDATVNKTGDGLMWFLNLRSDEGPQLDGCVETAPNSTCIRYDLRRSDGADAIFGDLGNDWVVGGTGQDTLWGGWGNDLLNADDVMTTMGEGAFGTGMDRKIQPSDNDTPDTHPLYQDRAYGGAGLDILIGNTGGDRLIDWVGEYNSYIVPFAPFGIATVSRQVPPWLYEFLYSLSASQGADPTRASDTGRDAERNGEPDGELGLITQKDHGLWQQQTGGPTDPQPGNIPGGRRDVLRSADFNDGALQGFFRDSGAFTVSGGRLSVAAESLGADAAAVFYVDQYLPIYYEIHASVSMAKATGGWKANSYVIFDYFDPFDFKFAGLDDSTNKIVMGHRDATGWHVAVQAVVKGGVNPGRWYDMLVAVNGTTVTVLLDRRDAFTYTFAPRVLDGEAVALNKGMVGVGSDNARGQFDNISVQVLPPQITWEATETFDDGAGVVSGEWTGGWQVAGGSLTGTPTRSGEPALRWVEPGQRLAANAYLEVTATLAVEVGGVGGVAFDGYGSDDVKLALLSHDAQQVIVGHISPRGGFVADLVVPWVIVAGQSYVLQVTIKGASISIVVDGSFVRSMAYNSALADGAFGVATLAGVISVDELTLRTDGLARPAPGVSSAEIFTPDTSGPEDEVPLVPPPVVASLTDATVVEGDSGTTVVPVTLTLAEPSTKPVTLTVTIWSASATAGQDFVAETYTVTLDPGQTEVDLFVTVLNDKRKESDETIVVDVSDEYGRVVATSLVTIKDDAGG